MYIYLDDLRTPQTSKDWIICRNFKEFTRAIMNWYRICDVNNMHERLYVSFDHDISSYDESGREITGYDAMKWLCAYLLDSEGNLPRWTKIGRFDINVHSANPIGKRNIEEYWKNFIKHIGE